MSYYRPRSNIIFSGSVKEKDEPDFDQLCSDLKSYGISKGEYFIHNYRENHQGQTDEQWKILRQIIKRSL